MFVFVKRGVLDFVERSDRAGTRVGTGWQATGRPGLDDLTATLHRTTSGWKIRTALKN